MEKIIQNFSPENLEGEIWLPVKDFENYYGVSNLGRFKSFDRIIIRHNGVIENKPGKILKNLYYSNGYTQLMFYINKKRFTFIGHRIVAQHFIPNPDNLPVVNHLNSIRDDNRAVNLEWTTVVGNMRHVVSMGRHNPLKNKRKGQDHSSSKLTDNDVFYIRKNYIKGKFNKSVFDEYCNKISKSTFVKICYGDSWKHLIKQD